LADLSWARAEGTVRNLADRRFDLYRIEWDESSAAGGEPHGRIPHRHGGPGGGWTAGDRTRSARTPRPISRPGMRCRTRKRSSNRTARGARAIGFPESTVPMMASWAAFWPAWITRVGKLR